MKLKQTLIKLCVLAGSLTVGLVLCEFGLRVVLNAADYLNVEMLPDPVFGATPSPNTRASGFDSWGFRNPKVPEATDIVAIGDSHTYGNTATMADSWPYRLAEFAQRPVYNMGLGGYGPNQYYEILRTKTLRLKPKVVICGLYMGDDFENAFLISYGLEHWAYLRELPADKVNFDIWEEPPAGTVIKKTRVWLARHSVVYQLIVHGPILGRIQGNAQVRNASRLDPSATVLYIPEKHIEEAFLPKGILRRLDQESTSVHEGMRITYKLLQEMNDLCLKNNAEFWVVVIPTKEMVFSQYLEHNTKIPLSDVLDKLIANERIARAKTFSFLEGAKIPYIDSLPALSSQVEHELYARSSGDMHPGKNGYSVIAKAVSEKFRAAAARN